MRAVIYVRNSSGKQVAAGTHKGLLSSGEETAARLGADVVAVYADPGVSAKSGNLAARGDFARLVADLPRTKPDLCIVANVDRLTRTELFRELGAIWGPLQEAGVRVATAGGQILDLATPEGQLLAMFESWRSSRENAARRERAITGRQRAAREGRNPGKAPFAYRCEKGKWTAPGAPIVSEIYERGAAGQSLAALAGELNGRGIRATKGRRWTTSSIADILRPRHQNGDPYVTGLWRGHKGEAAIAVPAIVSAEMAAQARAQLASRTARPPRRRKYVNLLDEHAMRCGLCGGYVRIAQSRGRVRSDGTRARFAYYVCEGRERAGELATERCTLPIRRVEPTDAGAWRAVVAWMEAGDVIASSAEADASVIEQAAVDLAAAREQHADAVARLDVLAEALGSGVLSPESYRVQSARLGARRDLLAQQVATWQPATIARPEPTAADRAHMRLRIQQVAVSGDAAARRELVRSLFPLWIADEHGISAVRAGDAIREPTAAPMRIAIAC